MADKWTFAADKVVKENTLLELNVFERLINDPINSKEAKRQRYERILNNLLDTLMTVELSARADGFDIKSFTHVDNGKVTIGSDGNFHVITAYGVHVCDSKK